VRAGGLKNSDLALPEGGDDDYDDDEGEIDKGCES
jgi:hypothetical protein